MQATRSVIAALVVAHLGAGCASGRQIDVRATEIACFDGPSIACSDALLADAAYVGPDDPSVSEALLLLLEASPGWYEATVPTWRELDADAGYGDVVASARLGRVTLHAAWSRPPELLVASMVHEAAHVSRPYQARHIRCAWASGCDDGDPGDGYVLVADFIEDVGWSSPTAAGILAEAVARSGR